MEPTRHAKTARTGLFVWLILGAFFLIDCLVYQDFQDDWDKETLKYGIVYIGDKIELLNRSGIESPQFESYCVDLFYLSKLEDFCNNFDAYMRGKHIFLRMHVDNHIEFLVECLKNTSNVKETDALRRLTVLTPKFNEDTLSPETIRKLQTTEIQLGLFLLDTRWRDHVQEALLQYQKLSMKIDIICGVVKIKGGSFYDYDTFVEVIDLEYRKTLTTISGFTPRIIFELDYQQKSWTEIYLTMGLKFLYRWGETKRQYVFHPHTLPSAAPDHMYWLQQNIFRNKINNSLMFGLQPETYEEIDYAMFENLDICSEVKSVLLEISVDDETDYEGISDLAALHNKLPCSISWNVMFNLNINNDSASAKNLEFISYLKTA